MDDTNPLPELNLEAPDGYMPSALMRILGRSGARSVLATPPSDLGLAENLPFPFLALVGQSEMRIALLL
jgi:hypothetical protein